MDLKHEDVIISMNAIYEKYPFWAECNRIPQSEWEQL